MKKWIPLAILAASLLNAGCNRSAVPTSPSTESSSQENPPAVAPAPGQEVEVALCVHVVNAEIGAGGAGTLARNLQYPATCGTCLSYQNNLRANWVWRLTW